jgi:hypothetical protein
MTKAEQQDLIRRTVLQVLRELDILPGADPRPGEGRSSAWRGSESEDRTDMDDDGELMSLHREAIERCEAFSRRKTPDDTSESSES